MDVADTRDAHCDLPSNLSARTNGVGVDDCSAGRIRIQSDVGKATQLVRHHVGILSAIRLVALIELHKRLSLALDQDVANLAGSGVGPFRTPSTARLDQSNCLRRDQSIPDRDRGAAWPTGNMVARGSSDHHFAGFDIQQCRMLRVVSSLKHDL